MSDILENATPVNSGSDTRAEVTPAQSGRCVIQGGDGETVKKTASDRELRVCPVVDCIVSKTIAPASLNTDTVNRPELCEKISSNVDEAAVIRGYFVSAQPVILE